MKKIKAIPLSAIVIVGLITFVLAVNLTPWTAYTPDIEVSGDGAFSVTYDSDIVGPIVYYEEYHIVITITASASLQHNYDVNMYIALTAPIQSPGVSTDQLLCQWGFGDELDGPAVTSWTVLEEEDWTAIGSETNPAGLGAGQRTSIEIGTDVGASAIFEVTFKFSVGPTTVAQGDMRFSCRVYGEVHT